MPQTGVGHDDEEVWRWVVMKVGEPRGWTVAIEPKATIEEWRAAVGRLLDTIRGEKA